MGAGAGVLDVEDLPAYDYSCGAGSKIKSSFSFYSSFPRVTGVYSLILVDVDIVSSNLLLLTPLSQCILPIPPYCVHHCITASLHLCIIA